MPFTTIALDRLIEQKDIKPMAAGNSVSDSRQGSRVGTDTPPDFTNSTNATHKKHHRAQISPALYATPEATPLPDLPSSFAPSPYIVDHKRRGPRLSKAFSEDDVALQQAVADEKTNEIVRSLEAEDVNGKPRNENTIDDAAAEQDTLESSMLEQGSAKDDFFDPLDSLSVRSSTDGESGYGYDRSLNLNTSVSEFYDAWEELSSESGSQSLSNDVETELREIRLSLLVEMEKGKKAEERLNDMKIQWGKIREHLSLVGLNLPEDPTVLENQSANYLAEELSRQVHLIRFVSYSIGRGVAKAEIGAEMEAQLETKNFEIARLLDRLRYYEAVNHEMSQRNQETIETMRRVRQRRKRRQRWILGSIVTALTIGSAALAWSYLPTEKGSSLTDPPPSHTSEGSHSAR